MMKLLGGTTTRPADRWWSNFHFVAVAGDSVANSSVFVADPNTNKGSANVDTGWPNVIPAARKFAAGDPIPIPGAPVIGNPASYNTYYAPLQLNNKNIVNDQSGDTFSLSKTKVANVDVVSPQKVGVLFDGIWPPPNGNLWKTVLVVNSPYANVDGIYVAPSSLVSSMSSLDSISLSGWTDPILNPVDPFGNTRVDGGIGFLSTAPGFNLMAGMDADLTLATMSSFASIGFDLFLHYAGNASNDWDVQIIDQNPPSLGAQYSPEPSSLVLVLTTLVWCGTCLGPRVLRSKRP
jgi:hypothetical protein